MSRILVDSSVWVEMFRMADFPEVQALGRLSQEGLLCTNGLIRAEILSGARSQKQFDKLNDLFSALTLLADPPDLWDKIAKARYRLARKGFQAGIADLIVGVSAAYHRKPLWTLDKAFLQLKVVLGFELFSIPKH
ncbi:MAG: PIN domain-containing protein [Elusimicrobia bacterium]|nr:PIN domain-containing protein [Elusimicrobiota bacterium]